MGELIFCIAIIAIILLISFYNLLIAILGLFSKFRATTSGILLKTNTQRNVRVRGGKLPVVTYYTYKYTVNGKKYSYSSSICSTKRRLYQTVSMVYVKWFPRHAYPEKFTAITQWAWGISMLFIGVLFIITVIVA